MYGNGTWLGLWIMVWVVWGPQAQAQSKYRLQGQVQDEEGTPLEAATVVLLQLPDSLLVTYTLTGDKGQFQLLAASGQYLLQASYVGYASQSQLLPLGRDTLLTPWVLPLQNDSLPMIEVTASHLPVQMRGDTLSFNSAAFEVRPQDEAGALLQQLPGLIVQEDGSIWFNGQKVMRVLVDGYTYFGDDAQAVLKNLSASAIKRVDITDAKEDNQGREVDDQKIIDLRLKEKAKNNWTTKVGGGYGHTVLPLPTEECDNILGNHRYQGELVLNVFTPQYRFTTYARSDNTNGSSLKAQLGALLANGSRPGVSRMTASGINYNLMGHKKITWNWNYQYQYDYHKVLSKRWEQSVLPELAYEQARNQYTLGRNQRHSASTRWSYKFDLKHELQLGLRLLYQRGRSEEERMQTTKQGGVLQNALDQSYQQQQQRFSAIPTLSFVKRFVKKGRELRLNLATQWRNNPQERTQVALTDLYNHQGRLMAVDSLSQIQYNRQNQQRYTGGILFKEPLGKKDRLQIQLLAGMEQEQIGQNIYDRLNNNNTLNTALTEDFTRRYNYQTLKMSWRHRTKLYRSELTAGLRRSLLTGITADGVERVRQEFYLPTVNTQLRFKFGQGKKLTWAYFCGFGELSLQELQPLVDNQNPLAQRQGNTNLALEQEHQTRLRLDWYNKATFTNVYATGQFRATLNSIVQAQRLDEELRTISQPVNAGPSYRSSVQVGYNSLVQRWGMKVDVSLDGAWSEVPLQVNNKTSRQTSWCYGGQLLLSNQKKKVVDATLVLRFQGGTAYYSNLDQPALTYLNQGYGTRLRWTPAKNWDLQTQFTAYVYTGRTFDNTLWVPLWTMELQRSFLPNQALQLILKGENLLGESLQIHRFQTNTVLAEDRSLLLGRHIMLVLRYQFKKSDF